MARTVERINSTTLNILYATTIQTNQITHKSDQGV